MSLAVEQEKQREREIRRLTKEIEKVLPNPMSNHQRHNLENVLVMNLNGEA